MNLLGTNASRSSIFSPVPMNHVGGLLERRRLGGCLLAYGAVQDQYDLLRLYGGGYLLHLPDEFLLLLVAARGVQEDHLRVPEVLDPPPRQGHGVLRVFLPVEGCLDGVCELLELAVGPRPERVGAYNAHLEASLLVVAGELGAVGSLAGALDAHHHEDVLSTGLDL